jgi:hypothetical protein
VKVGKQGSEGRRKRRAAVLAVPLALALLTAGISRASGPTTITSCSYPNLNAAVQQGGSIILDCGSQAATISFPAPITVAAGNSVAITTTSGRNVTFDGGGKNQLFVVNGGTLSLSNVTLADGLAQGTAGTAGLTGGNGTPGTFGTTGDNGAEGTQDGTASAGSGGAWGSDGGAGGDGSDGADGLPGGKASDGGDAAGGAMYIAAGSQVTISNSSFTNDHAIGGAGGKAGDGGTGGDGGYGGSGGDGGTGSAQAGGGLTHGGHGGSGGNGGDGGSGADAGEAADGGNALGGAIYNAGSLQIISTQFGAGDFARGGQGGDGGAGGAAGAGGIGGGGGAGGETASVDGGHGGDGGAVGTPGQAGQAGSGSDGGNGGDGMGGAIYNTGTGTVSISSSSSATPSSFIGNFAEGGAGGSGGDGGAGAYGGIGGNAAWGGEGSSGFGAGGIGGNGADGSDGTPGTNGGAGGNGGVGGAGQGGALASENTNVTVDSSTLYSTDPPAGDPADVAIGGAGGSGGAGGDGGHGGDGGWGGPPGGGFCGNSGSTEDCGRWPAQNGDGGNGADGKNGGNGGAGGSGQLHGGSGQGDTIFTPSSSQGGTAGAGGGAGKGGAAGDAGAAGLGGKAACEYFNDCQGDGTPGSPGTDGTEGAAGASGSTGAGANPSGPPSPKLFATSPASPGDQTAIKLYGWSENGSTVNIYTLAGCTGAPAASGGASDLESGLAATALADTTTSYYATATDDSGTSACTPTPLDYTETSAGGTTGGGAGGNGNGSGGNSNGSGGSGSGGSPTTAASGGSPTMAAGGGSGGSASAGGGTVSLGQPHIAGTTAGVPVTCSGGTCSLRLILTVTETIQGGRTIGVAARKTKRHTKVVQVGSAAVTLTAGETKTVSLALNGAGRRLLATYHKLATRLTVTNSGKLLASSTLTFKASRARKRGH